MKKTKTSFKSAISRVIAFLLCFFMVGTSNLAQLATLADDTERFVFQATVDNSSINSGEGFEYKLSYKFPPLADEATYINSTFQFSNLEDYHGKIYVKEDANGIPLVSGAGIVDVLYIEDLDLLSVTIDPNASAGQGITMAIQFGTNNLVIPDGTVINLDPVFSGSTSAGTKLEGSIEDALKPTVTVHADDGWAISKQVGEVTVQTVGGVECYVAPYTVTLQNINPKLGQNSSGDRTGRLAIESITIKDILPTADTGSFDTNGNHLGYPTGGAAVSVYDVKMEGAALTSGTDYSFANNSLTINKIKQAGTANYVPSDAPVTTQYTYKVAYPKAAYLSAPNVPEEDIDKYNLINSADLTYKLLGKEQAHDDDQANIILGDKETTDEYTGITVLKKVKIDGVEYDYQSKYGAVSFALYKDPACTSIALNYTGTKLAGSEKSVGVDGTVKFDELYYPSIYYLKEVKTGDGLTTTATVTAISIDENKNISLASDNTNTSATIENGKIKIVNNTNKYGNVKFLKYGLDSEGKGPSPLAGATFELSNSSYTATATSDANGLVFFEGVPAGNYTLRETQVTGPDYVVTTQSFTVTVVADQTVAPTGMPGDVDPVGGVPVFENVSPKGKFKVKKVAADSKAALTGAEFDVYKKTGATTKELVYSGLKTGSDGYAVSQALDAAADGTTYILVETKAPVGYALDDTPIEVTVYPNKVTEKTTPIENKQLVTVYFHKTGAITRNGQLVYTEELAGAEFEIYDNAQGTDPLYTVVTVLDAMNLSTSGLKEDVNKRLQLDPNGEYWYKETVAPGEYERDTNIHKIDLSKLDKNAQGQEINPPQVTINVQDTADYGEIEIKKVDAATQNALNGAKFSVYTDEACTIPAQYKGENVVIETGKIKTGTATTDAEAGVGRVRVPASSDENVGTTYYLKETAAPSGYIPNDEVIRVLVYKNKVSIHSTDILNVPKRTLKVYKEDSQNQKRLSGATFELYGPYDTAQSTDAAKGAKKTSGSFTAGTGQNAGTYTFSQKLDPTKYYYVKETKQPDGYAAPTQVFTEVAPQAEGTITTLVEKTIINDPLGDIKIHKVTDMNQAAGKFANMSGVSFSLYKAKLDANGDFALEDGKYVTDGAQIGSSVNTDNSGNAKFEGLTPGKYVLVEGTVAGYPQHDPIAVTVTPGMNKDGYDVEITDVTNIANKGKLQIEKVSSTNANTHVVAVYDIFKADENGQKTGNRVTTITSSSSSTKTSGWLEPGNYVLIETSVTTAGYTKDETPIPFTITAGQTTKFTKANGNALTNDPQGKATISKKSSFGVVGDSTGKTVTRDLTGAKFDLYKKVSDDPAADIAASTPVKSVDMTNTAMGDTGNLDEGSYWLVETQFPSGGYYPDAEQFTEVTKGSKKFYVYKTPLTIEKGKTTDVNITITNKTTWGRIRINKFRSVSFDLLNGAEFEVYIEDPNGTVTTDTGVKVRKLDAAASKQSGYTFLQSGTDGAGSTITIELDPGEEGSLNKYWIQEVFRDETKIVDPETGAVIPGPWAPEDGDYWHGPFTLEANKETVDQFVDFTTAAVGIKTGVDGKSVDGAVFAAFATDAEATAFKNAMAPYITYGYNESTEKYEGYAVDATAINALLTSKDPDYGIVETSTVAEGIFVFNNLVPGRTYYIVEAIPPTNYALNTQTFVVTVRDDGQGFTEELKVNDGYLGNIKVTKSAYVNTPETGREEVSISGVHFSIYKAVSDASGLYLHENGSKYILGDKVAEGTSDSGTYTSVLLPEGVYIVVEDKTVEGVNWPEGYDEKGFDAKGLHPYKVATIDSKGKVTFSYPSGTSYGTSDRFYNLAEYGRFAIKKVDENGTIMSGIQFYLYKVGADGSLSERATIETTSDGVYTSGLLEPGTYMLHEIADQTALADRTPANDIYITVEAGKTTGSVYGFDSIKDSYNVDLSANVTNTEPSSDVKATSPIIIVNRKKGNISIWKAGVFNGELVTGFEQLVGARFNIYKADKDGNMTNDFVQTLTTVDAAVAATSKLLDAGVYWIQETDPVEGSEAAKYFTPNTTPYKVVVYPGVTTNYPNDKTYTWDQRADMPYPFINDTTYGKFQVTKVDANSGAPLQGVIFDIYTDADCTVKAKDIDGKDAKMTATGADGKAVSPLLTPGTAETPAQYWIKEVSLGSNTSYAGVGTIYGPFTVQSNTVKVNEETLKNKKYFNIQFTKWDRNYVEGFTTTGMKNLQGAKFGLFTKLEDAQLTDAEELTAKALLTATSNASGVVTFGSLTEGPLTYDATATTYYVKEISAPDKYTADPNIYEVIAEYGKGLNSTDTFTINADATNGSKQNAYNDPWGTLTLHKWGSWQSVVDEKSEPVPLSGVEFSLYKVDACGDVHTATTRDGHITTDTNGDGTSERLPAGWYEVVETTLDPAYCSDPDQVQLQWWAEIKDNKTDAKLYNADGTEFVDSKIPEEGFYYDEGKTQPVTGNIIVNIPDKGRFELRKFDGNSTLDPELLTGLVNAQFFLEKWDETESKWIRLDDEGTPYINMDQPVKVSGAMMPGKYRVIEKENGTGNFIYQYTDSSNVKHTVQFTISTEPIEFEIKAGTTTGVKAYNSPKGSVSLTKYGIDYTGETSKKILAGAKFALFTDADCTVRAQTKTYDADGNVVSSTDIADKVSDGSGKITWDYLDPGEYWIKEQPSDAVTQAGYAIDPVAKKVIISDGMTVKDIENNTDANKEKLNVSVEFTDEADQGKLRILKLDADNEELKLKNAKFEVYAKTESGWAETPIATLTTDSNGAAVSALIPASMEGTEYKIVEVKAPSDYSLDGGFNEATGTDVTTGEKALEWIIKLYPIHVPAFDKNGGKNCIKVTNKKVDALVGLSAELEKAVREYDGADDTWVDSVGAPKSLITDPYTVEYKLDGYGDGTNEKPIKNLTIIDGASSTNAATEYGMKSYGIETGKYVWTGKMDEADYKYDSVTINPALNGDTGKKVGAIVYVMTAGNTEFDEVPYELLTDVSTAQTVSFGTDEVIAVKVVYTNTLERFTSEGIILQVTFKKMEDTTAEDYETRRITNSGHILWNDTYLDADGKEQIKTLVELNSNIVETIFPELKEQLPVIEVLTEITDSKSTFAMGETIHFQVTGFNRSDEADKIVEQPVLSFKLPADVVISEDDAGSLFKVYKHAADDSEFILSESNFSVAKENVPSAIKALGDDQYIEDEEHKSDQYTFVFNEGVDLAPNEYMYIVFEGQINYLDKSGIDLVIPGYMSSNKKLAPTKENPKGLSFTNVPKQPLVDNETANKAFPEGEETSAEREYVNSTDSAIVTSVDKVQLVKEVSPDGINWSTTRTAQINAADKLYYRLTVYNYTSTPISHAKLIDVFPGEDDTYITYNIPRNTTVPFGEAEEPMLLLGVTGGREGDTITYYYSDVVPNCDGTDAHEDDLLRPLYYDDPKWAEVGWTEGLGEDSEQAKALGIDVQFAGEGLPAGGGSCQFVLEMRAPGYSVEQIPDYYGKLMNNSAALAVIKTGAVYDETTKTNYELFVEPALVKAQLVLPFGSIGDYVWLDSNLDGIQDEDEKPVPGVRVELIENHYFMVGDVETRSINTIATTETDSLGYYKFERLNCKYLKDGHTEDETSPTAYVHDEYYEYQVRFIKPKNMTFTLQNAGEDITVDSNADLGGYSEVISLHVTRKEDGKIYGEDNMTIDAGLVQAMSLGNYVWLDMNMNGVQDTSEKGVPGVPVYLYRVVDGEVESDYFARTETDENGLYLFEDLFEGQYVVEFDTSTLQKLKDPDDETSGYTYKYAFTTPSTSATKSDFDSDAKYPQDEDERIMRTDIIDLYLSVLEEERYEGKDTNSDLRWDAGLVVYSALGGFAFDDADYNDLSNEYHLPLLGTVVQLYDFDENMEPTILLAEQTVGADGRYFFDKLIFPTEYHDYAVKFIYPERYLGVEPNVIEEKSIFMPADDELFDSDVNIFPTNEDGTIDRTQGFIQRIRLAQDQISLTWDGGARMYSAIGDYVWLDENKDGLQDPEETPIADQPVFLQMQSGSQSAPWETIDYTTTDETGWYMFYDLKSSKYINVRYRVVFAFDQDTVITTLNSGEDSTIDSDAIPSFVPGILPVIGDLENVDGGYVTSYIKPEYGETDPTWDCGIYRILGAIGDYVWYDTDYDGLQSDTHIGVPGVKVELEKNSSEDGMDENAWEVIAETVTDEEGYYLFPDLERGYYRVAFYLPQGYVYTKYNRGAADVDSDASRPAGNNKYYSEAFYLPTGIFDMTWDAGIFKPVNTGDAFNAPLMAMLAAIAMAGILASAIVLEKKRIKK